MPCPPRISPPLHCARQAAPDDLLGQGMSPGHEHWKQKSSQICLHLCESANTKSCSTLIISKHSSAEEEISIDCTAVTTCWGFTTVGSIDQAADAACDNLENADWSVIARWSYSLFISTKPSCRGLGKTYVGKVCFPTLPQTHPSFSKLWDWVDILKNLSYKYMLKSYI